MLVNCLDYRGSENTQIVLMHFPQVKEFICFLCGLSPRVVRILRYHNFCISVKMRIALRSQKLNSVFNFKALFLVCCENKLRKKLLLSES